MELSMVALQHGATVIRPSGRLDLLSAPDLKQQLVDAVAAGQRYLVVDLAEVPFIDSSGLGALVGGLKAARLAGGDLRIARASAQARVVLELTTLNRVLRPYDEVDDAVADFTDRISG